MNIPENFGNSSYSSYVRDESAVAILMRNVYAWMALALVITGLTAYYVSSSPAILGMIFSSSIVFYGLMLGELALVWYLGSAIQRLSFSTATMLFAFYSILNGVTMSSIFLVYTTSSIASTFFITAGMFGVMALIGSFIKKDLSSIGRFCMMALIGIIIASVVNIFVASSSLYWIVTYGGVVIFAGLTAYDAQNIKNMLNEYGSEVNESTQKIALLGSLSLYLDFINMFLYLLRILGSRR